MNHAPDLELIKLKKFKKMLQLFNKNFQKNFLKIKKNRNYNCFNGEIFLKLLLYDIINKS